MNAHELICLGVGTVAAAVLLLILANEIARLRRRPAVRQHVIRDECDQKRLLNIKCKHRG